MAENSIGARSAFFLLPDNNTNGRRERSSGRYVYPETVCLLYFIYLAEAGFSIRFFDRLSKKKKRRKKRQFAELDTDAAAW